MGAIDSVCTVVDDRTLCWSRRIDAPIERIWRALTDVEEMAVWFMECRLDLRVGGEVVFNTPDPFGGTISRLEPPHLYEVDEDGGFMRFEVGEDRVAFTDRLRPGTLPPGGADGGAGRDQPGGPGTHWDGVAAGWHCFLDALDAYVRGVPLPGQAEYGALVGEYRDWLRARFAASR